LYYHALHSTKALDNKDPGVTVIAGIGPLIIGVVIAANLEGEDEARRFIDIGLADVMVLPHDPVVLPCNAPSP